MKVLAVDSAFAVAGRAQVDEYRRDTGFAIA